MNLTVARVMALTVCAASVAAIAWQAASTGIHTPSLLAGIFAGAVLTAVTTIVVVEIAGRRRARSTPARSRSVQEALPGSGIATVADFEEEQQWREAL